MANTQTENKGRTLIDPTGEKKIILSIDGGGMRGAITLAMLAELEKKAEAPCNEIFDMFVGTSTGAIISVGLAIGYSARELLEEEKIYGEILPKAFRQKRSGFWLWASLFLLILIIVVCILSLIRSVDIFSDIIATIILILCLSTIIYFLVSRNPKVRLALRIISNGLRFAYPTQPFLDGLLPLIEKKNEERKAAGQKELHTLGDLDEPILLVTSKDVTTGETNFIVNAGKGKAKFADWPLSAAVAASGSAPIFFPPVVSRFLDGGVGVYGNPCFIAAVEALEYISEDFTDEKVILVSLGTGYPPDQIRETDAETNNVFDWLLYVINQSLNDSLQEQVALTRKLYGDQGPGKIDFRRYNPLVTKKNVQETLGIQDQKFADIDPEHLGLDSYGEKEGELMVAIGKAYGERIDWSEPNAMPWDQPEQGGQPDPGKTESAPVDWEKTPYKHP